MEHQVQIQTVVCPNCGANATNLQNCEYCGSMLVRVAAKNNDVNIEEFIEEINLYDTSAIESFLKKYIWISTIKENAGFVDLLYNSAAVDHIQIAIIEKNNILLNIYGINELPYAQYETFKEFISVFDQEESRDDGVLTSINVNCGLDVKVCAKVIYKIIDCQHPNFDIDNLCFSIVDIAEEDILLDSNGNYLDSDMSDEKLLTILSDTNTEENSNRGCFGLFAAIIGLSIASLSALLLPIIM